MTRTLTIDDGRIQRELMLVTTTLVGRDPECEISHADPRLSRRHAEFRVTADGVVLRDLGSRNGTHVNGQPIEEVVLRPGDVVQIAHLSIRFNDPAAAPTVHMGREQALGRTAETVPPPIHDDRTRVLSRAESASSHAPPASLPRQQAGERRVGPSDVPAAPGTAWQGGRGSRLQPTTTMTAATVEDIGEVVIRDVAVQAGTPRAAVDLSVYGLAGSAWGRRVLLQGLALAVLVLLLTAIPLLAWEARLYGSSAAASWPVLLPVVIAAAGAGIAVASLIARTTAAGLLRREE